MTPSEIFTLLRQELAQIPPGEPVAVELTERTPDGERAYRVERGPGEPSVGGVASRVVERVEPLVNPRGERISAKCKVAHCGWLAVENGYCEDHAEHDGGGADVEDDVAERMLP